MNEEEKKAVEILNTFELRRKTKNYKEISLEDSQSVEIVLNLIEKLQKENEELNIKYYILYTEKVEKMKAQEVKIKSQVILKQKVKDKIAELKAQYKTALEENSTEAFILKCQITILQELIEEREEKKNGENI